MNTSKLFSIQLKYNLNSQRVAKGRHANVRCIHTNPGHCQQQSYSDMHDLESNVVRIDFERVAQLNLRYYV